MITFVMLLPFIAIALLLLLSSWRLRRLNRQQEARADLHYTARLEREVYGEVVSESLRDLPPPNPFVGARRREAGLVVPMYITDEMQRAQGAPSPTRAVRG